jgi:hypothetical protein
LHVKTISVTLKLWYLRELSVSGKHEPFLDTAQRLAESGSSGSLLAVALTGALGWSLTREALSIRERRMLGLVFTLYAAVALSKSLCYDDDSDACRALMLVEYVIQSVLMLTVVIALNFTAAQLRLMLTEARWNNFATPLTYMKLNQFQYGINCAFRAAWSPSSTNCAMLVWSRLQVVPKPLPSLSSLPDWIVDPQCMCSSLLWSFVSSSSWLN